MSIHLKPNKVGTRPAVASSRTPLREKAARLRVAVVGHYLEVAGFIAVASVAFAVHPAMFKV